MIFLLDLKGHLPQNLNPLDKMSPQQVPSHGGPWEGPA